MSTLSRFAELIKGGLSLEEGHLENLNSMAVHNLLTCFPKHPHLFVWLRNEPGQLFTFRVHMHQLFTIFDHEASKAKQKWNVDDREIQAIFVRDRISLTVRLPGLHQNTEIAIYEGVGRIMRKEDPRAPGKTWESDAVTTVNPEAHIEPLKLHESTAGKPFCCE